MNDDTATQEVGSCRSHMINLGSRSDKWMDGDNFDGKLTYAYTKGENHYVLLLGRVA